MSEETWKVVGVDNLAREYVADIPISEGHTKEEAKAECARLNAEAAHCATYYMPYPASRRLSKGMADFT